MGQLVVSNIFVYRNCFTGAVAGGDVHINGVCEWLLKNNPDVKINFIFPRNDGQELVYPELRSIPKINYRCPNIKAHFALIYFIRAVLGAIFVRIPWGVNRNVLVASSHFLPDVLPVYCKGQKTTSVTRIVYIHHIIQDMTRSNNINTLMANLQERLCFALIRHRFDKVIVVNHQVANRLRQIGFRNQQILVSSNFVSSKYYSQISYSEKNITIAYCGRMVAQKRVIDFLEVCAKLQKIIPNFNAVAIGTGPELDFLQGYAKKRTLAVEFTGYVKNYKKFNLLARSKLFIFPSVEEGWGIAIAEALSVSTPVIAYSLPVYSEIFGDLLHVVEGMNYHKLAQKAQELLQIYENNPDKYYREQMKISSSASKFTLNKIANIEYKFWKKQ